MDSRLLDYYARELAYMRELAQEFAEEHPKVASRLGMNGLEVADPYVERLLQGFSFLSARVQLQMDEQFPQFSQHMLDALHPCYLLPTPSMAVVELLPRMSEGSLVDGFPVPRHSALLSRKLVGDRTQIELRTAHDVLLWPIAIDSVSCTAPPPNLPLRSHGLERKVKGALRIGLRAMQGGFADLDLDRLTFYLAGPDASATRLAECLFAHTLGVIGTERKGGWWKFLGPQVVESEGYGIEQAIIPTDARAFDGYRQLYEYFAMPQRYRFFTLSGLKSMVTQSLGDTLELTVLFDVFPEELETAVDSSHLKLFCTPAVNLFLRSGEPLAIDPERAEHLVPADKAKPKNYEFYSIEKVAGWTKKGGGHNIEFAPLRDRFNGVEQSEERAYYTLRRETCVSGGPANARAARSHYGGDEIYFIPLDAGQQPLEHNVQSLSITALYTNRDLATAIAAGAQAGGDFDMQASMPVESASILHGMTEPRQALAQGDHAWQVISHLELNALTLSDLDDESGAQALRELLSVYGALCDRGLRRQIESVRHCRLRQVARVIPGSALGYGYGVHVDLTVDEALFDGASPYLFGSVLERLFARHVSQNSFSETSLHTVGRGHIATWRPRPGMRPVA